MKTLLFTLALLLVLSYGTHLSCFAADADPSDSASVDAVLSRYIKALGGRDAIENLTSRTCIGTQTTDLTGREHPVYELGHYELHSRTPIDFRTQTWNDHGHYIEGFDGHQGWIRDQCGVQAKDRIGRGKIAFLMNPQGPLLIDRYFPDLKSAGRMVLHEHDVYALRSDSLKPEYYTLYFSANSGLLIAIGYHWWVEDYREVDGVLVPHRLVAGRKGGSVEFEFETVRHGDVLADSLFTMPEG